MSRNKYRNVKQGGKDSGKEARRAVQLRLEARAGLITDLEEQPRYLLIPKQDGERSASYTADFRYKRDGVLIVEDVKSEITRKKQDYVLRRKLMLWVHGIRVLET